MQIGWKDARDVLCIVSSNAPTLQDTTAICCLRGRIHIYYIRVTYYYNRMKTKILVWAVYLENIKSYAFLQYLISICIIILGRGKLEQEP
jgi:hypothetical protein